MGVCYLHCDSSHKAAILSNIREKLPTSSDTCMTLFIFWRMVLKLIRGGLGQSTWLHSLCHPFYNSLKSIDFLSSLLQVLYLILKYNLSTGVSDIRFDGDDCLKFPCLHHSSFNTTRKKWQHSKYISVFSSDSNLPSPKRLFWHDVLLNYYFISYIYCGCIDNARRVWGKSKKSVR